MKNKFIGILIACIVLMILTIDVKTQDIEKRFQDALHKEVGEGELLDAIAIYNEILSYENADRSMKAKVLLHIGSCHQKLGNNKAADAYRTIINNYGDQEQIVDIARSRLDKIAARFDEPDYPGGLWIQQVWTGSNVDGSGSISPDGKYLSTWDYETGNLGYRDLTEDTGRLLTTEGTYEGAKQFTINSIIAPDGKHIAYSWYNQDKTYEIRLINIESEQYDIIYSKPDEEAYPVSWSADGKRLLARRLSDLTGCQLIAIELPSLKTKKIKQFESGCWMRSFYSPDNRFVAFDVPVKHNDGNYDIYLIDTKVNEQINLVEHPANDRLLGWIPEREQLLFTSDRTGTIDLWIQNTQQGRSKGKPVRIMPGLGNVGPLGFTDHNAFYYGILSRKRTTFLLSLSDSLESELEPGVPLLGSKFHVEFSPDGIHMLHINEIIKKAGPGWYKRPAILTNLETGEETILCENYRIRYPRWSADGNKIVFSGYDYRLYNDPGYFGGIYQIDINSKEVEEIVEFPDWSIDTVHAWNECVAEWFNKDQGVVYLDGSGIWLLDLLSGSDSILLKERGLPPVLDISASGDKVLFSTSIDRDKPGNLKVLEINNGLITTVCSTQNGEKIESAVWSFDDSNIFFCINTDHGMELWRVDMEGGSPERIWTHEFQNSGISIDKFHKNLAVSVFMQQAEVWMMQNIISTEANKK